MVYLYALAKSKHYQQRYIYWTGKYDTYKNPLLNAFVIMSRRIRKLLQHPNKVEARLELVKRQMVSAQLLAKHLRLHQHYFRHELGHLAVQPKRQPLHLQLHVELLLLLPVILHHLA